MDAFKQIVKKRTARIIEKGSRLRVMPVIP